jgi:hypothetical protein
VPDLGSRRGGIGRRKAEIAFEGIKGGTLLHRPARKGVTDRDILADDLRKARRRAIAGRIRGVEHAEIFRRPADRIENGLARRQKTIAIGPTMIVWRTIWILAGQVHRIRSVVRGPRAGIVLADQQAPCRGMVIGCETNCVAVPIAPREGLDGVQIAQRRS